MLHLAVGLLISALWSSRRTLDGLEYSSMLLVALVVSIQVRFELLVIILSLIFDNFLSRGLFLELQLASHLLASRLLCKAVDSQTYAQCSQMKTQEATRIGLLDTEIC